MTNVLTAIKAIIEHPISNLVRYYQGRYRNKQIDDALECFIQDVFADTVTESDKQTKLLRHSEVFSYSGNANSPPNLILKNGDAIKIKQIESSSSEVKLTDSYPRAKLFYDDPTITSYCRNCENWIVKDILYVIGITQEKCLTTLWLVYGDCYFADREVYEDILRRSDPLGITSFSSGKSNVTLPDRVFEQHCETEENYKFRLNCVMKTEKYLALPENDRKQVESLTLNTNLAIKNVLIKNPNTPQNLTPAKVFNFGV